MPDDPVVSVIIALVSVFIGFALSEIHEWIKNGRKSNEKQEKCAKILYIDTHGIGNLLCTYQNNCHRPEYDEYREAVCIAKRIKGDCILSQTSNEISNLGTDIALFDISIITKIFDLKWALYDFVNMSKELLDFNDTLNKELENHPEEHEINTDDDERWIRQMEGLAAQFVVDYNFLQDRNSELRECLKKKYNF